MIDFLVLLMIPPLSAVVAQAFLVAVDRLLGPSTTMTNAPPDTEE